MTRIAVTFVHGVEINDPHYADTAIGRLKAAFTRHAGVDANEALVIRPTFWAPELQNAEDRLYKQCFGDSCAQLFRKISGWVTDLNAGHSWAALPLAVTSLLRHVPGISQANYPMLRWTAIQFLGDAVAYQQTGKDRKVYDAIHARIADAVHRLADEAGGDAPLCVIGHSLGTVIASNYLYDLEVEHGPSGRQLVAPPVASRIGATPMERGETLALFYTLGSPIALWTMRFRSPDFGLPITVPSSALTRRHPGIHGEWINFWDPDDLVGTPLKGLSEHYATAVTQDLKVDVGPWWMGWTPMAHWWYWNDDRVIDPIATALARVWRETNQDVVVPDGRRGQASPIRLDSGRGAP
ncbi:MAG TPA: hypothetical protein VI248_02055 [Kineosporiaceae bacterium]